ncbi:TPA: hypothetical protein DCX16_02715 [bacterium]|nr:hypothetical protein [bacterium]
MKEKKDKEAIKPNYKKRKSLSNINTTTSLFLLIIKGVLVALSGISFSFFILKLENPKLTFSFLKSLPFVIIFLSFWLGFSYIVSRFNKTLFLSTLSKDAISFFPIILLSPFSLFLEKTYIPNIVLHKLFFFIIITSIAIFIKTTTIKPFQIKPLWIHLALGIFMFLYSSIYSFLSFLNYINLSLTKIGDMALFDQIFWDTIHGKILYAQGHGYNFLGEHFSPAIIILAPFYLIFPHPCTLMALQSMYIGIGAIPIYLIANDKLKNPLLGLSFSLAYLLYPMTSRVNLLEFHEITLCIPFLLFTFYFLEKERWGFYFLFLFLSMMVKENIPLTIIGLGFYILLIKKKRAIGFVSIGISIIWAYLSIKVLIPYIREATSEGAYSGYQAAIRRYSYLGETPLEIIRNLLFHPQKIIEAISFDRRLIIFNNIIYLLNPLGFLSLTSIFIILAIPEFLLHSLANYGLQYLLVSAHPSPFIPIVLISGIYGLANIMKVFPSAKKYVFAFSIYILSCSLLSNYYFSFPALKITTDVVHYEFPCHKTIFSIPLNKESYIIKERARIFFEMKKLIPKEAIVSASSDISPYFSQRKILFGLDRFKEADYLILNTIPSIWIDMEFVNKTLNEALKAKDFQLIFDKEGFYLFVKKSYEENLLSRMKFLLLSSPQSHLIRGSIYFNLKEEDRGLDEYKKAVLLYSKNKKDSKAQLIGLHYFLAKYYYEKKNLSASIYELEEVVKLNPSNIQARENLEALKKRLDTKTRGK